MPGTFFFVPEKKRRNGFGCHSAPRLKRASPFSYERLTRVSLKHAALVLADDHALGPERPLEYRERLLRLGVAAHEDVERRIAALRPCVHADVTLRQHGHAGNPAAFREGMQMNVQKSCARGVHRVDQRLFDQIPVVEPFGFPQIDDQVTSRKGQTVACDEVVLAVLISQGSRNRNGPRGSAGASALYFFDRRYEFESSHSGTYPLSSVDTQCVDRPPLASDAAEEKSSGRKAVAPLCSVPGARGNIGPLAPHARIFVAPSSIFSKPEWRGCGTLLSQFSAPLTCPLRWTASQVGRRTRRFSRSFP